MTRERLSLEKQLELFDRYADAAIDHAIELMQTYREVLKRRARSRMQSVEVLEEYDEDASWHLPHAELLMQWLDEGADQIVYGVMMMRLEELGDADALRPVKHSRALESDRDRHRSHS